MSDSNEDTKWQSKVDEKLDTIGGKLDHIQHWQTAHEALDMRRFSRLEVLMDHDTEQKAQIRRLTEVVVGNGREGLTVRTDRLERTVSAWKKFLWLLIGAAITGAVATVIALL